MAYRGFKFSVPTLSRRTHFRGGNRDAIFSLWENSCGPFQITKPGLKWPLCQSGIPVRCQKEAFSHGKGARVVWWPCEQIPQRTGA
jgi:hypothetical protein